MVFISPSLVSAPLTHLVGTVALLEEAGVDLLHFDLEDGSFVPVMNLGTRLIEEIRPLTDLPFDVHLMMVNPEWIIPLLASMGVWRVSVHFEACPYPRRTLGLITGYGMQAGLAFNPKTDIPPLGFCLPFLSSLLLLSTEPEVETCTYLPQVLEKLHAARLRPELQGIELVVDGGVTASNAGEIVQAGAGTLVSGRGIFQDGKIAENLLRLRQAAAAPLRGDQ
jgi:ribulose-phosphate 3-epimerase